MAFRTGMFDGKSLLAIVAGAAILTSFHNSHSDLGSTTLLFFKNFLMTGLAYVPGFQMLLVAEYRRTQWGVLEKDNASILLGKTLQASGHRTDQNRQGQQRDNENTFFAHRFAFSPQGWS